MTCKVKGQRRVQIICQMRPDKVTVVRLLSKCGYQKTAAFLELHNKISANYFNVRFRARAWQKTKFTGNLKTSGKVQYKLFSHALRLTQSGCTLCM